MGHPNTPTHPLTHLLLAFSGSPSLLTVITSLLSPLLLLLLLLLLAAAVTSKQ
jgi:hypothetical protein